MIELIAQNMAPIMFASLVVFLLLGYPVAFALAANGLLFFLIGSGRTAGRWRPLIVLTFAFLNGLYAAGIASTFAMALGTGITVAALAALAVWAKDAAIRVGGAAEKGAAVQRAVEIGGAALVFLFGATLLSAALTA